MKNVIVSFVLGFTLSLSALADVAPIEVRLAVEMDDADTLAKYINKGEASPNSFIDVPSMSKPYPIIVWAARMASRKVVRYLITAKADLNKLNGYGETALMLAAFFYDEGSSGNAQHHEVVKALVEAGASLENSVPGMYTPVSYAAFNDNQKTLSYLLEHGADVNAGRKPGESVGASTPLMTTAINNNEGSARILLNHGANPLLMNRNGDNAITLAKKYGRAEFLPLFECAASLKPGEKYQDHCSHL